MIYVWVNADHRYATLRPTVNRMLCDDLRKYLITWFIHSDFEGLEFTNNKVRPL